MQRSSTSRRSPSLADSSLSEEDSDSNSGEDVECASFYMLKKLSSMKKPTSQMKIDPSNYTQLKPKPDLDFNLPPTLKVKPIASNPTDDGSKAKKPKSKFTEKGPA